MVRYGLDGGVTRRLSVWRRYHDSSSNSRKVDHARNDPVALRSGGRTVVEILGGKRVKVGWREEREGEREKVWKGRGGGGFVWGWKR